MARRKRSEYMPKVGDKFYWEDSVNRIHESICYEIVEQKNHAIMYYTTPKGEQYRTFVTEYDILDPELKRVKKYREEHFFDGKSDLAIKAIDFICDVMKDDSSIICEELHDHPDENKYCAENCNNLYPECVLRYLKYYKKK